MVVLPVADARLSAINNRIANVLRFNFFNELSGKFHMNDRPAPQRKKKQQHNTTTDDHMHTYNMEWELWLPVSSSMFLLFLCCFFSGEKFECYCRWPWRRRQRHRATVRVDDDNSFTWLSVGWMKCRFEFHNNTYCVFFSAVVHCHFLVFLLLFFV